MLGLQFLLQAQGKYDEAEPLYRRALDVRERALGKNHLDVASSLNYLAVGIALISTLRVLHVCFANPSSGTCH
jgi:hypothetical protein